MIRLNSQQVFHPGRSFPPPQAMLERTTDLSAIGGSKVLAFLDEQNLSIGAKDLGYQLDYSLLADAVNSAAARAKLHVFTTDDGDSSGPDRRFEEPGYVVHAKAVRCVPLPGGSTKRDGNIDNLLAFHVGLLATRSDCEVILLGSGDYGLSGELAKALASGPRHTRRRVMTLSLPGSTARDLDARVNPHIEANLEIGLDVLEPMHPRTGQSHRAAARDIRAFCSVPVF